jgi:hypothetical protein
MDSKNLDVRGKTILESITSGQDTFESALLAQKEEFKELRRQTMAAVLDGQAEACPESR